MKFDRFKQMVTHKWQQITKSSKASYSIPKLPKLSV